MSIPGVRSRGATVLLVDDSELTCESVRVTLEEAGFEVVTLNGPFGFIKAVRERNPKVILIDVGLGTMNGKKLVTLARDHAPASTRIVLYSGRPEEELKRDKAESGADGFISKRSSSAALVAEVTQWAAR
jgi:DNA-binding response OmpR family regulator